ncbi:hypothetical protein LSH36_184g08018 [Paralvinella palmiformis]|uniref:ADAMTS/ADAMTS-like Spacer 1 domain-containing protein n=1 Tax=Paralvinella palmiformis TaxID=53620 RepID=A0AAD9JRE3_9ANNE|nr:hypothetical protein LSH36_184g08018 [Paralvinella palmiformis]
MSVIVLSQRRSRRPSVGSRARSRHHLSNGRDLRDQEALWTTWSRWTPCSFTCDRGVRSRYRGCVQRTVRGLVRQTDTKCEGTPREYQMCEEQPCPLGSGTPKEYQCAQKNKVKVLDKIYEWTPLYIGSSQCDLTCMASGHAFYNNFGHASDGTPCGTKHTLRRTPAGDQVERVCINGTCLAVGCDGMVDSGTRLDKCRVCGGENANCYHFRNSYMILEASKEGNNHHDQYQDMVVIPEGATYVEVTDHSDNYLALADDRGTFILNGNFMIDWPGRYEVDNTVINYERRGRAEIVTIEGPTTRKLILKLLFRERNPGVHYEFYIPSPKIDEITVPERHPKNQKTPTYIPPPLRPPRYGTGSGANEAETKVEDAASVAPPTGRPTTKPRKKGGVELPLSRILDEMGNLVEAKPEAKPTETSPKSVEEPPVADQVKQGDIPWYLKAHRSQEFDDLLRGGIPLAKPNSVASALNAHALYYGGGLYQRPTTNNGYNYALYGPQSAQPGYCQSALPGSAQWSGHQRGSSDQRKFQPDRSA